MCLIPLRLGPTDFVVHLSLLFGTTTMGLTAYRHREERGKQEKSTGFIGDRRCQRLCDVYVGVWFRW